MVQELKEVPQEYYDTMTVAKVNFSLTSVMFTYMLYRCKIVPTLDPKIPTAGALIRPDGNYIYINVDFWLNVCKNAKERAFILLHEIQHIFLNHQHRGVQNGYDHMLYNIAADYNINLVGSGAYTQDNSKTVKYNDRYKSYMALPDGGLYDEKYIGMSADEIYHKLLEENGNDAQKAAKSVLGSGQNTLDDVFALGGDNLSPEEQEQISAQIAKNNQTTIAGVMSAKETNSIGQNEMNIVRAFEDLVKPVVNWREKLQTVIDKKAVERTTYSRINRRNHNGIIFSTYEGSKINLVFGVDTSGSMSQADISRAVSELYGLLLAYDQWKVHFISCDTKPHIISVIDSESGQSFDDIDFTKMIGGGGTLMSPMLQYANNLVEDSEDDLNALVILTDGYLADDDLQEEAMVDVLVVVTENRNSNLKINNHRVEVLCL